MTDTAIRVESIAKQYRLGQIQAYGTLRDSIADAFTAPIRRLKSTANGDEQERTQRRETLWALRDVSFDVRRGEVVGIVGRNGAGKTTLLKIMSRITFPTEGQMTMRGRVGSLLEVGTGFNLELTGRENIFLNGAILGMRRTEIQRKFDEIVEFSGVGRFLDTPVKRYSTGMAVRLAFSVAAHLETEIILVDEVLSVGDVEFQRKCLGKMEDVTTQGRTVVFVSHNLTAVRRLCDRAILLNAGRVEADGPTEAVLATYLSGEMGDESAVAQGEALDQRIRQTLWHPTRAFRATRLAVVDDQGVPRTRFGSDEPIDLVLDYEVDESLGKLEIVFQIVDEYGYVILRSEADDCAGSGMSDSSQPGAYRCRCRIPANVFGERRFYVNAYLESSYQQHIAIERALYFDVEFQGYNGNLNEHSKQGFFRLPLDWSVEPAAQSTPSDR
jgi:homopolymeric O-antigen transport system ATP-binding protein